jgi:hypothetical protein
MAREFVALFKSTGAEKVQGDFNKIGQSTTNLDKGLQKVDSSSVRTQRRMSELGVSVGGLGRTLAGLGIAKALGDAVMSAASFETSMRGVTQVLGEATATDISTWIEDQAGALNITQTAAANAARGLSVYGKQLQGTGVDVAAFTTDLIEVAGNLGAFNAADPGEVLDSMQAALRGEFDPLEKFGVALTAAKVSAEAVAEGLVPIGEEMSSQDKIIATYNLLMEDSAFAMGAVEGASETLPGQLANLRQEFGDMGTEVGSAVLPPLTLLVTTLGDLVKGFNKLPGPVKVALAALVGIIALRKTLGPAFTGLTEGLRNFRTEMGKTQGVAGKFKTGMGSLVGAFNPWTLAITGGLALLTLWIQKNHEAKAKADEWAHGINGVTGALNEQGKQLLVDDLVHWVDEMEQVGITSAQVAKAISSPQQFQELIGNLQEVAAAHSEIRTVATKGGAVQVTAYDDEGQAAQDLVEHLLGLNTQYTNGKRDAENYAQASDGVTTSTEDTSTALTDLKDKVKETSGTYRDLLDSFNAVNDAMVASQSTIYDYQGAIDDLAEALVKGKGSFSPDTEAGREDWDKLVALADTANGRIQDTLKRKGTQAAETVFQNARKTMLRMLTEAGVKGPQAWNLINDVLKKPHQVSVKLNDIDLARIRKRLAKLKEQKAEIKAGFEIPPGTPDFVAKSMESGLKKKLKPVQVQIDAALGKLGKPKEDLDKLANPKGKPRTAHVSAKVDPESLRTANTDLNEAAKRRDAYIYVHTVRLGEDPGSTAGPALSPSLFSPDPKGTLGVASRALVGPMVATGGSAGPAGSRSSRQAQEEAPVTRLGPRQTPVAVYLDGVEIAHRIEARRALAATTSVKRSA